MEPALVESAPASAPPPSTYADTAFAPDGNVIAPPSSPPVVDAPRGSEITPKDGEVPFDLDHPPDAQPDLREAFPDQPQPEQREQPQPQPQEALPQEPAIPLPAEFAGEEEVWARLPRETQTSITGIVEHVKSRLAPQIEQATQMSAAHHEALWGSVAVHSKKAAALIQLAQTNPQQLEAFAQSPDGQRFIAELGQERDAIRNHGKQIVEQFNEAKRVESEQLQSHFDNVWGPSQDDAFWDRMGTIVPPDQQDALQDQAVETLRDAGFSEDEIHEGYERSGMMRDARSQVIIAKAALYDQMQARLAAAKTKAAEQARERSRAISKPLMPGVGGGPVAPSATLARAAAEGDMQGYINLRNRGAIR
jgi:hypothetical protein